MFATKSVTAAAVAVTEAAQLKYGKTLQKPIHAHSLYQPTGVYRAIARGLSRVGRQRRFFKYTSILVDEYKTSEIGCYL